MVIYQIKDNHIWPLIAETDLHFPFYTLVAVVLS